MDIAFLVSLPFLAIATYIVTFIWRVRARSLPIKGPSQLPILGNTIQMLSNEHVLNKYLIQLTNQFGTVFHLAIPASAPFICTSDPDNVEHILKSNFDNYPKGAPFQERLFDLLGQGIFNADGQKWKTQRKTASHIFTMKALRDDMCYIFVDHAHIFNDRLALVADNTSQSVDIQDMFFRYTLDSICLIAFGVDLHCLTTDGPVEFAVAFDTCQKVLDSRFFDPFWRVKKMLSIGAEGRMNKSLVTIHKFAKKVIADRGSMNKEQLTKRTDLLSQFMVLGKDADGNKFTETDYKDIILNFIIAGRDTTAQNLSWLFYELCEHPDVEQKVAEEIRSVLGKDGVADYDICTNKLPYLHSCVVEALRLHPSVPKELKHAVKDDVWPDGTKVPAGTGVIPLIQALMRRTAVWGKDAEQFRPERWESFEKEPDAFKYPAFQAGPRTCLGKHMALLEAKVAASMILNKYRFRLVPNQIIEEEIALTLPARYGIKLYVETRK